jgi:SAM-dependent methyltransferase
MQCNPRLYDEFACWWPILSAPEDYAEEAEFYRKTIVSAVAGSIKTILELGSGGGNNASHLKAHFQMTLVDLAPGMPAVSQKLNPECGHIQGDMRTVRLNGIFDAVFIHDAISYMTSLVELQAAIDTAFIHCRSGGVALFAPDHTKENYRSLTKHGGHDKDGRSLRYLEWTWDPNPADDITLTDFAYILRDEHYQVRVEYDRHVTGLFYRADWLRILKEVGFEPQVVPFEHNEIEPNSCELFVSKKP